ncbi:uncharacterized protein WM294_001180 [Sarcoramphus papa]
MNPWIVKDLLLTPIGMDLTLMKKFLQHNDLCQLLERAREEGQRTLITVHHDTEEIHRVLDRVKKDGEHRWWEAFLGWSPKTTGILNLMLHPVVILLLLTCLCLLLIIILYFKVWHMMKQIALMQSPRVCTLMTEGHKSLKLENFLIKDRKKFQILIFGTTFWHPRWDGHKALPGSSCRPRQRTGPDRAPARTDLLIGDSSGFPPKPGRQATQRCNADQRYLYQGERGMNPWIVKDLLLTPIGMDLTLMKKFLQHNDLCQLLERAREEGQRTLITVHHDTEEIHRVLDRVKKDGEHRWWEAFLGWSPKTTGILNLMLHPVVILLLLTCLCLLLIIILYFKVWHMMKQIALMQSPRVCTLMTEGHKSLKLENFLIKDRKKFQILIFGTTFWHPRWDGHKALPGSSCCPRQRTGPDRAPARTDLLIGDSSGFPPKPGRQATQRCNADQRYLYQGERGMNPWIVKDLLLTPIGMDLTLMKKFLQHNDLCQLLERAREEGQRTLITVHHDTEEIHRVLDRVKKDGEHRWWEAFLGWSPKTTGILNLMLHPVVILLLLTCLCLLLIIILYFKVWHMMKQIALMQSPRVCTLMTEGHKSLKLENFLIKDRKKFQILIFGTTFWHPRWDGHKALPGSSCRPRQRTGPDRAPARTDLLIGDSSGFPPKPGRQATQRCNADQRYLYQGERGMNPWIVKDLLLTPIGMDLTLMKKFLQHNDLCQLLERAREEGQRTLITVHHDTEEIHRVLDRVKKDGEHRWWEAFLGWSPKTTGILNLMLHPVVILLLLTCLCLLLIIILYFKVWHMMKQIALMQSPRVCTLMTEGHKSLKLENFLIKDRKKFQILIFGTTFWHPRWDGHKALPGSSCRPRQRTGPDRAPARTDLLIGDSSGFPPKPGRQATQRCNADQRYLYQGERGMNPWIVKDLLLTPIGMDLTLMKKFLQHNDLCQLLERAREEGQRTLITVHHDTEEIHRVLDRVKKDGEHRWWEAFLGWSPKTTGILNLMLHPVVILLLLTCLCLLLIIILYFKVWHMMKQIALMQSPRVCTLMTEGHKSLKLENFLIKDRKKFQILIFGTTFWHPRWDGHKALPGSSCRPRQRTGPDRAPARTDLLIGDSSGFPPKPGRQATQRCNADQRYLYQGERGMNPWIVKDLLLTPIGMDLTLMKKFLQHNDLCQLLERAREEGQRTLITVHHDTEEIHRVLDRVKKDGEHRWWEAFLGWSPKTTGILNLMLHPVVILLLLTCLCLLLIIILYFKVWHMMKQIALMQSPRVCTLMTEGHKSLKLENFLIKDRKKFQILIFGTTFWHPRWDGHKALPGSSCRPRQRTGPDRAPARTDLLIGDSSGFPPKPGRQATQRCNADQRYLYQGERGMNPWIVKDLLLTPIGMDLTLMKKFLQHNDLCQLLERAREEGQRTLITVHHDTEEIHRVLDRVKKDGEHRWWEAFLGWSPKTTGILNLMLHPVVILLLLTCLCLLLIIILYFKVWHMMKQIALMQSPRVCTLMTEGHKSLKLENFLIKDRKKFQLCEVARKRTVLNPDDEGASSRPRRKTITLGPFLIHERFGGGVP